MFCKIVKRHQLLPLDRNIFLFFSRVAIFGLGTYFRSKQKISANKIIFSLGAPIGRTRANKAGPKKFLFRFHFERFPGSRSHFKPFPASTKQISVSRSKKWLSGLREQRANRKKVFSAATPAGLRPEQQTKKKAILKLFIFSEAKSQSEQEQQAKKKVYFVPEVVKFLLGLAATIWRTGILKEF